MVTEFERSHRVVARHTITVTSWYDEDRQVWQTSAPSYMHVSAIAEASHSSSESRSVGLANLTLALERHFSPPSELG